MENTLYILSKLAENWHDYEFILDPGPDNKHVTVVLMGEGVSQQKIPADHVYVLEGEKDVNHSVDTPSHISYHELLELVFTSDTSIVV